MSSFTRRVVRGATHVASGGLIANAILSPHTAGYPDATNTGVPSGVALTPSGSITVTTNGAIIDGLDISGQIVVNADNVTIRNCRITSSDYYPIDYARAGLLIEDCEIIGTADAVTAAVSFDNYTIRRCNIGGTTDGLKANSDVVIEDCYIHDLRVSGGSHNDGIQSTGGSNVTVRHNTIDTGDAGVAIQFGSSDTGWLVTDNLIHSSGWAFNGGAGTSNDTFTNNRFAPVPGWYGPIGVEGTGNVISGNYYDDTGNPI